MTQKIAYFLLLLAITFTVYANSLHCDLVFDDKQIVLQNPALMAIHSFNDVLKFGAGWRQLLFFTYGLNFYLGGLDTFNYHLTNLLLHMINVVLVFWILLTMADTFAAFAGAAIFAVHPLFSSAVSYIAGRSSVLCATFYFTAILFFLKALEPRHYEQTYNDSRRLRSFIYFVLAAASGLLAWQAKQEAITLPLFLGVLIILRVDRKYWLWLVVPLSIPVAAVYLMRAQLAALYDTVGKNQILVTAGFDRVLPWAVYINTYITSIVGYYLPRFIFPSNLSADPYIAPVAHWYSPEYLFSVLVLWSLGWICVHWYHRRQQLAGLGIMAILVSPLAAYVVIPLADVVLEHRAYIPGLGAALLFAYIFQWITRNYYGVRWYALSVLLIVFGLMTMERNVVWSSEVTLWQDAERAGPLKPRTHFNLGQAYQELRRLPEAITEYQHTLALKPDTHAAYSNMAAIYIDAGQYDKAEEVLLKITTLAPEFTEGWINLGVLYLRTNQNLKALPALDRAVHITPDSVAAQFNMGEILTRMGDFMGALECYKIASELRPDILMFKDRLALMYAKVGAAAP